MSIKCFISPFPSLTQNAQVSEVPGNRLFRFAFGVQGASIPSSFHRIIETNEEEGCWEPGFRIQRCGAAVSASLWLPRPLAHRPPHMKQLRVCRIESNCLNELHTGRQVTFNETKPVPSPSCGSSPMGENPFHICSEREKAAGLGKSLVLGFGNKVKIHLPPVPCCSCDLYCGLLFQGRTKNSTK